ncbi:DUF6966 domain-containing protein [Plantactinospora sp. GCM10030261]|uniref:DUF6966 domain-containing protein n=1 Tax=Plantactinospora sp. GCM10030261 TaxID=3273420 RepID=UPI00361EA798
MTVPAGAHVHDRLRELKTALEEMEDLLRQNDAGNWADWIRQVLEGLERRDADALENLLGRYRGGMGSFNDLVVGEFSWSGGPVPAAVRRANDRLNELRDRCYSAATYLRDRL